MRELAREGGFTYVKLEEPADIDRVQVRGAETDEGGFEFFRGLGIVGYARTFKAWLRHFPRPIFLAALRDREVSAWVFVEEHGEHARDGNPLYVLRAIETLPELRGKRLGHRLVLLVLAQVSGHVLTKPLTKEARAFFVRVGFEALEEGRSVVEPRNFPGYVGMTPQRRREVVAKIGEYFPSHPDGVGGGSREGGTGGR